MEHQPTLQQPQMQIYKIQWLIQRYGWLIQQLHHHIHLVQKLSISMESIHQVRQNLEIRLKL
jgi:hypothetical protein